MFWTHANLQYSLIGEDCYQISSSVSRLISFAESNFPQCDNNFHRQFAFLSHDATVKFLRPMLASYYGSVDAAKLPALNWLDSVGSFETLARCTRNGGAPPSKPSGIKVKGLPNWYAKYCKSDRFFDMKLRATEFYTEFMGGIRCAVNARHHFQVFHHSDYGRLGEADEFRFLVPYCNDCHCAITARGPNVPSSIPEAVKQWI